MTIVARFGIVLRNPDNVFRGDGVDSDPDEDSGDNQLTMSVVDSDPDEDFADNHLTLCFFADNNPDGDCVENMSIVDDDVTMFHGERDSDENFLDMNVVMRDAEDPDPPVLVDINPDGDCVDNMSIVDDDVTMFDGEEGSDENSLDMNVVMRDVEEDSEENSLDNMSIVDDDETLSDVIMSDPEPVNVRTGSNANPLTPTVFSSLCPSAQHPSPSMPSSALSGNKRSFLLPLPDSIGPDWLTKRRKLHHLSDSMPPSALPGNRRRSTQQVLQDPAPYLPPSDQVSDEDVDTTVPGLSALGSESVDTGDDGDDLYGSTFINGLRRSRRHLVSEVSSVPMGSFRDWNAGGVRRSARLRMR